MLVLGNNALINFFIFVSLLSDWFKAIKTSISFVFFRGNLVRSRSFFFFWLLFRTFIFGHFTSGTVIISITICGAIFFVVSIFTLASKFSRFATFGTIFAFYIFSTLV